MDPQSLLSQIDDTQIVAAIREAEKTTSGEIRVFVTHKSVEDPLAGAKQQFAKLGMAETALNNGILLLVAPKSQNLAIFAGERIYDHYPHEIWESVVKEVTSKIPDDPTAALCEGIARIGDILKETFPYQSGDRNELGDDVIRE